MICLNRLFQLELVVYGPILLSTKIYLRLLSYYMLDQALS